MRIAIALLAFFMAKETTGAEFFAQVEALYPDYRFSTPIWRDRTAVAQYFHAGETGWYLIDVDESGAVVWLASTEVGPEDVGLGRYAMELGQGADGALAVGAELSQRFAEANPMGAFVAVPKFALVHALKNHASAELCYEGVGPVTSLGWGGALASAATMIGLGPAGAAGAGVAALFAGAPSHEQKFWACAPRERRR